MKDYYSSLSFSASANVVFKLNSKASYFLVGPCTVSWKLRNKFPIATVSLLHSSNLQSTLAKNVEHVSLILPTLSTNIVPSSFPAALTFLVASSYFSRMLMSSLLNLANKISCLFSRISIRSYLSLSISLFAFSMPKLRCFSTPSYCTAIRKNFSSDYSTSFIRVVSSNSVRLEILLSRSFA